MAAPAKKEEPEVYREADLTDALRAELVGYVEAGASIRCAGVLVGVRRAAVIRELDFGRRDMGRGVDSVAARFVEAVDVAWERRRLRIVKSLEEDRDWKARAFILEREYRMVEPKWEDGDMQVAIEKLQREKLELQNRLLLKDLESDDAERAAGRLRDLLRGSHRRVEVVEVVVGPALELEAE